ncbi:HlyD family type I secretion periplasmic adaptor subunit [Oleispirillum naphthae]|uniref:HlyD family type I secretion periplasmic adaptor subunit n=1 Tax=Oleispirillum naphthae TaxID=2838853 RepID=UPI0030826639
MPETALDALLARHAALPGRRLAWVVSGLVALFLFWAAFAPLDEVAVAEGEVIPQGQVKVVQHLEGGIVIALMVKPGSVVKAGDPLLQLDLASTAINRDELMVRIDSQRLAIARLAAEAEGKPLVFPPELEKRYPDLARAERDTHRARLAELQSTLSVLQQQHQQKTEEVRELEAKEHSVQTGLRLAQEKLAMSKSLLSEGLTSKMDHLQLQSEVESLRGQMSVLSHTLPRAKAALQESANRAEEARLSFRREASETLGTARMNLARNAEYMNKADDQQVRTEIRSPIAGIVKNMRYVTIGGVVQAGAPIMEIVPTDEKLQIDVRLMPKDRGYVRVGQKALVKISTYDYSRYGGLDGVVTVVAPDASTDAKTGQPYFQVIVETEQTWMGNTPGEFPISPGMQATADIHTGTRSVLDYLIRPVLKLKHEAFRER